MAYLLGQGWRIEAHRFRLGHHDLDLIARRGDLVAFVEVKARRSRRFGLAAEAVGPRKRAVLLRLAELWRVRFGRPSDRYRFDLIAVEDGAAGGVAGSTTPHLTHIEGAWAGVER
jgi:putative endonuclease